jgi:drug/metabolite transporter (DMT)-like permease
MTFRFKWEPRKFFAVSLATVGVLVVVYGGSTSTNVDEVPSLEKRTSLKPSAPVVGDLLTLVASLGYALYQVLYKKFAALPSDPELVADTAYDHLPVSDDSPDIDYEPPEITFDIEDVVYPPPFGLHPNLLTSAIGLCTLSVFWVFIPVLHYMGVEQFLLPGNLRIVFTIVGIALSGVVFNAGFMVTHLEHSHSCPADV